MLFITTGAHEDYHTPDDMASRINYNGVEQVIDFTADLVAVLSDMPVAPVFVKPEVAKSRATMAGI